MRYVKNLLLGMVFCFTATAAMAGSLDSPAAPTNAGSAMYKLEDVYNRANDGTAGTKRTTTYGEPASGPADTTAHTLTQVYDLVSERSRPAKTGQIICYDPSGSTPGEVACTGTGQDGDLKKGVTWPSSSSVTPSARFTSNSANTVTDNLTGLMWDKNANRDNTKSWIDALIYCNDLILDTYSDWRLPNRFELESLLDLAYNAPALSNDAGTGMWISGDAGSSFTGVRTSGNGYWSSTTKKIAPTEAWIVYTAEGTVTTVIKDLPRYVWPVRGGQS
jgi:hypothetical protein